MSDHEFHSLGKVVRFFSQFCFLEFCQIVHQICSSCALFLCLATEGFGSQLSRPLFCSKVTLWPPKNVKFLLFFFFLIEVRRRIGKSFLMSPTEMITWSFCLPVYLLLLSVLLPHCMRLEEEPRHNVYCLLFALFERLMFYKRWALHFYGDSA